MIILGISAVIIVVGAIIGFRIYQLSRSSSGDTISDSRSGKALVVLDIQNDTLSVPQYKNSTNLVKNINQAIKNANEMNIPVVYSKQEFNKPLDKFLSGGVYQQGSTGSKLSNELSITSEHIFSKEKSDLFSSNAFEEFLSTHNIKELYLIGADASSCVLKTTEAGLARNYKVTVLKDCLFSIDKKRLNKALNTYKKMGANISDQIDY
ncbi:cysteine hydrolase family protein [Candidatus Enterococcus murrayae]|uniref:Cysteine hydrolase n=1 Tax=Candidatus Enterococcus murrayae TaxID=2815321 RepID=A0ABS3HIW7_9ENTE|nr:cysteine hydrolase [Enterococcus sp. MJM16]MBO0453403.1 cysteine hydrolase [Enterococcus sp. MJM16]